MARGLGSPAFLEGKQRTLSPGGGGDRAGDINDSFLVVTISQHHDTPLSNSGPRTRILCGCIRHPRLHDCSLWDPRSRPRSIIVLECLSGASSGSAWKQSQRRVLGFESPTCLASRPLFPGRRGRGLGTSAARIDGCSFAKCTFASRTARSHAPKVPPRFRRTRE